MGKGGWGLSLALRGFTLVAHTTVAHAVGKIDGKPNYQPDTKPEPCVAGQTQHEQNGGQRSRRRHEIDSWRLEGPLDVWLRHAQREHAQTHDSKRKQRANADQLADKADRQEPGENGDNDAYGHRADIRCAEALVDLRAKR